MQLIHPPTCSHKKALTPTEQDRKNTPMMKQRAMSSSCLCGCSHVQYLTGLICLATRHAAKSKVLASRSKEGEEGIQGEARNDYLFFGLLKDNEEFWTLEGEIWFGAECVRIRARGDWTIDFQSLDHLTNQTSFPLLKTMSPISISAFTIHLFFWTVLWTKKVPRNFLCS